MIMTKEQDVVAAKTQITVLKRCFTTDLNSYIANKSLQTLLTCQRSGVEYFNYVEEFVGNSSLLGAHENGLWAQGFAEDCAEVLRTMPNFYELLSVGFRKFNPALVKYSRPNNTAFANMQRMVVEYLTDSETNDIKKCLKNAKLPLYCFSNEVKNPMDKKLTIILSFAFGVTFIVVILLIALLQPNPTSFQYTIFRAVLALAGAGVAAVLPGFIQVRFRKWLRAGGALAVFAILYFLNPAAQFSNTNSSQHKIEATPDINKIDRNH